MMGEEKHEEVEYHPDLVPPGFVLRVIAATVIISVALCVVALLLLRLREHALRPSGKFPEAHLPAPHEVANVRAAPFEVPAPVPALEERQRALLDSYGWVDRAHGVVRIPVKRAVELMLRQQQTQPRPQVQP